VFRVAGRLGLVEEKLGPEKAQTLLEQKVPPQDHFSFHILLIRHGRHMCSARAPNCAACPLLDRCPAGQAVSTTTKHPPAIKRAVRISDT
jgi:endonuclease-3